MNMMKMMKQAQEMQAKAAQMQAELATRQYEVQSGGGRITATVNGEGMLMRLKIDPELAKQGDAEILEDLIVTAVREAVDQSKKDAQQELSKLTAGLGMPGLF